MAKPGPRAKNLPVYDASRRSYRLRKPGGSGWYPTLLSGVPDTEGNFNEACRIARQYLTTAPVDVPASIGDVVDNWLAEHLIMPTDPKYGWAMSLVKLCGRDELLDIRSDYLKRFRLHMETTTYRRHRQKTRHNYSQTTVSKYGKFLAEILAWAGKKEHFQLPDWVDPGWPEPKVGRKHVPFDQIPAMLDALLHPKRAIKTCPNCKGKFQALGLHLHIRTCTGKRNNADDPAPASKASKCHPCYWLVRFALDCGGRPDELCQLKWEYIDFVVKVITIPEIDHKTGKATGETRKLYPNDDGMEILKNMPRRQAYVFLNEHGRPYKPSGVRQALKIHCGVSGMYALRHTFAQGALLQGLDVTEVQKLLQHKSVTTTMEYLRVLDAEAIRAARRLAAPHELANAVQKRLGRAAG